MFGMSAERNEVEDRANRRRRLPPLTLHPQGNFVTRDPEMIVTMGYMQYITVKPHLLIKYRPRVVNVRYECRAERSGATAAN